MAARTLGDWLIEEMSSPLRQVNSEAIILMAEWVEEKAIRMAWTTSAMEDVLAIRQRVKAIRKLGGAGDLPLIVTAALCLFDRVRRERGEQRLSPTTDVRTLLGAFRYLKPIGPMLDGLEYIQPLRQRDVEWI